MCTRHGEPLLWTAGRASSVRRSKCTGEGHKSTARGPGMLAETAVMRSVRRCGGWTQKGLKEDTYSEELAGGARGWCWQAELKVGRVGVQGKMAVRFLV